MAGRGKTSKTAPGKNKSFEVPIPDFIFSRRLPDQVPVIITVAKKVQGRRLPQTKWEKRKRYRQKHEKAIKDTAARGERAKAAAPTVGWCTRSFMFMITLFLFCSGYHMAYSAGLSIIAQCNAATQAQEQIATLLLEPGSWEGFKDLDKHGSGMDRRPQPEITEKCLMKVGVDKALTRNLCYWHDRQLRRQKRGMISKLKEPDFSKSEKTKLMRKDLFCIMRWAQRDTGKKTR